MSSRCSCSGLFLRSLEWQRSTSVDWQRSGGLPTITVVWNCWSALRRVSTFSVINVQKRPDSFQIDPTVRHSWWSLMLGGMFTYVSVYGVNQVQVQRYLTMKDYKTAVRTLWFSWPVTAFMSVSMCFAGLAIFSKYRDCDPIKLVLIELAFSSRMALLMSFRVCM